MKKKRKKKDQKRKNNEKQNINNIINEKKKKRITNQKSDLVLETKFTLDYQFPLVLVFLVLLAFFLIFFCGFRFSFSSRCSFSNLTLENATTSDIAERTLQCASRTRDKAKEYMDRRPRSFCTRRGESVWFQEEMVSDIE